VIFDVRWSQAASEIDELDLTRTDCSLSEKELLYTSEKERCVYWGGEGGIRVTRKTKLVRDFRLLQWLVDSILANKSNYSGDRGGEKGGGEAGGSRVLASSSVGVGME
jgi:hypothetical protein